MLPSKTARFPPRTPVVMGLFLSFFKKIFSIRPLTYKPQFPLIAPPPQRDFGIASREESHHGFSRGEHSPVSWPSLPVERGMTSVFAVLLAVVCISSSASAAAQVCDALLLTSCSFSGPLLQYARSLYSATQGHFCFFCPEPAPLSHPMIPFFCARSLTPLKALQGMKSVKIEAIQGGFPNEIH